MKEDNILKETFDKAREESKHPFFEMNRELDKLISIKKKLLEKAQVIDRETNEESNSGGDYFRTLSESEAQNIKRRIDNITAQLNSISKDMAEMEDKMKDLN